MDHQYLYLAYNTMLESPTIWLAEIMFIILALLPDIVHRAYRDIKHHRQLGRHTQVSTFHKLLPWSNFAKPNSTYVYVLC